MKEREAGLRQCKSRIVSRLFVLGMVRSLLAVVAVLFMMLVASRVVSAEEIERVISQIRGGTITINAKVEVSGFIDKWRQNPAGNTWAYDLRDDWGDVIKVVSQNELPETEGRYKITGIVNYDFTTREYALTELARERTSDDGPAPADPRLLQFDALFGQAQSFMSGRRFKEAQAVLQQAIALGQTITPSPPGLPAAQAALLQAKAGAWKANFILYGLIGLVILAGAGLVWLLKKKPAGQALEGFPRDAVITVTDKTQKITAPIVTEAAIREGTVKVMPGRFQIKGGVELKEIRLIRPRGVADHQIEYTFGRETGDRITHLQLSDLTVSSRQARLKFARGSYTLINIPDPDDPDRNATQVNGAVMRADESRALVDGDLIRMGNVEMTFKAE